MMEAAAIINQPVALGPRQFQPIGPSTNIQLLQIPLTIPCGLHYLLHVHELRIRQRLELLEVLCGCETRNRYEIYTGDGIPLYRATEESDCFVREMCGPLRPFEMIVTDIRDAVAIHFSRPLSCQGFCCPCCLQSLSVYSPPGVLVGSVEEQKSCTPLLFVRNNVGDIIFRIEGQFSTISFTCGNVDYPIISQTTGSELGKIVKRWTGCGREALLDADSFSLTFPIDLELGMKATLIGALFLIDFMYYEKSAH